MKILKGNIHALVEAWRLLNQHRLLAFEMARREIFDRYSGQALGLFWTVAHPVFMMGLYVFIFVFVFKTKIRGDIAMPLDYTTYILAGLIPWLAFQESLSKTCVAITSNANLVKQVVFPIEVLSVKSVLASGVTQAISTVLLLSYVLIAQKTIWPSFLLIPILMVFQLMMMIGLGFMLSVSSAFFRDLKDFVQLYCLAGVYLLPVFYLPEWIPPVFKPLVYLNPFSYMVWCYQDAIYFGGFKHPVAWVVFPLISIVTFVMGYRLIRRLKPMLGNVL